MDNGITTAVNSLPFALVSNLALNCSKMKMEGNGVVREPGDIAPYKVHSDNFNTTGLSWVCMERKYSLYWSLRESGKICRIK